MFGEAAQQLISQKDQHKNNERRNNTLTDAELV